MDELIDELSGTTIDEEPRKNGPPKSKNTKTVERYASIINRSKLLILSDSESNDEDYGDKHNNNKCARVSKQKHMTQTWKAKDYSTKLMMSKRKRNSGSEMASLAESIFSKGLGVKKKIDKMEVDLDSSSELSDTCSTDYNFDGDDELSDFYECTIKTRPNNKNRHHSYSKQKLEFKMPRPVNPFYADFDTHSPNNNNHNNNNWKRRRAMH